MLTDTIRELVDRKIIWVFVALNVISLIAVVASAGSDIKIQGQGMFDTLAPSDYIIKGSMFMLNHFIGLLVFVAAMAAAGLFPRMLIKGRADYYLSRPLSRDSILFKKTSSVFIVYGGLITASLLLNGIAIFAAFQFFHLGILVVLISNLLQLLIWLSITTAVGIATGSGTLSIIGAFIVWLIQVTLTMHIFVQDITDSRLVRYIVDGLYYIFPKTSEISGMTVDLLFKQVDTWIPVYTSVAFALVAFAAAFMIFRSKDY